MWPITGFMLDTSAINAIHDGVVEDGTWTSRAPVFATDIQFQEIARTRNADRRGGLLSTFLRLRPHMLRPGECLRPAEGHAPGAHDFGFEEELQGAVYEYHLGRWVPLMVAQLRGGRGRLENRFRDGFIAQAAMINGLTLVTADGSLCEMSRRFGVNVEFIRKPRAA